MTEEPIEADEKKIRADYARSNFARVIHADGAFGGLTNSLQIHMAIFSERRTSAQQVVLSQGPNGLVQETSLDPAGVPLIIREVEADVILSANVARAIRDWLSTRLDELDAVIQEVRASQPNPQKDQE